MFLPFFFFPSAVLFASCFSFPPLSSQTLSFQKNQPRSSPFPFVKLKHINRLPKKAIQFTIFAKVEQIAITTQQSIKYFAVIPSLMIMKNRPHHLFIIVLLLFLTQTLQFRPLYQGGANILPKDVEKTEKIRVPVRDEVG